MKERIEKLPGPWEADPNHSFWQEQVKKELSTKHPLYHLHPQLIARDGDDVLVILNNNKFATIHLTFCPINEVFASECPSYKVYDELEPFYAEIFAEFQFD